MISRNVRIYLLRLLGIACIIFSVFYTWNNIDAARMAEKSSQDINQKLQIDQSSKRLLSENDVMPVSAVSGVDYLGKLTITSENITLPVAAKYRFEQMSLTPTRYRGSYKTNDLVICAHNYRYQFNPLRTIPMGEKIEFETVDGKTYSFVITNREIIKPTAVEEVIKETSGDTDWDLSLFTCNPSGAARVIIRCQLVS